MSSPSIDTGSSTEINIQYNRLKKERKTVMVDNITNHNNTIRIHSSDIV